MQIVGGVYRELCCVPDWDAIYGSGGRAAAAISSLSPDSVLHTYLEDGFDAALISRFGIPIRHYPRSTGIAFSYFHPLSRPHIEPPSSEIIKQSKIEVNGDVVLRFGFLEGDSVISARRAVYDPQTWRDQQPFGSNGSIAKELAIVLNELELRCATGIDDIHLAASHLMEHQGATIVVAKGGVKGATVFESNRKISIVPAYRSSGVFKIGTGDIFSAVFTHYWGEKGLSAAIAADIASRSVSVYCSTMQLPVKDDVLSQLVAVKFVASGSVLLHGGVDTIGQRYTMEEARFILKELGVNVLCPQLGDVVNGDETAVLLIEDGLGSEVTELINRAKKNKTHVVLLQGAGAKTGDIYLDDSNTEVVDDFSSALYFSAWAAAENASSI